MSRLTYQDRVKRSLSLDNPDSFILNLQDNIAKGIDVENSKWVLQAFISKMVEKEDFDLDLAKYPTETQERLIEFEKMKEWELVDHPEDEKNLEAVAADYRSGVLPRCPPRGKVVVYFDGQMKTGEVDAGWLRCQPELVQRWKKTGSPYGKLWIEKGVSGFARF